MTGVALAAILGVIAVALAVIVLGALAVVMIVRRLKSFDGTSGAPTLPADLGLKRPRRPL